MCRYIYIYIPIPIIPGYHLWVHMLILMSSLCFQRNANARTPPTLFNVWLSRWLTFKLLGITYLIGKIEFKLVFHAPLAESDEFFFLQELEERFVLLCTRFQAFRDDCGSIARKRSMFFVITFSGFPCQKPQWWLVERIPSLKLTFSPLKMDGWNTILSYWGGLFSGAKMLVSGRVKHVMYTRCPGMSFHVLPDAENLVSCALWRILFVFFGFTVDDSSQKSPI